jgi:CheY-like chemotaxis protein
MVEGGVSCPARVLSTCAPAGRQRAAARTLLETHHNYMAVMQQASESRRRVLVVDDNRDSADSLKLLLQLWGHDAECAYGGEEALATAAGFGPQIVLLDIGLPGMSGYELVGRLRQIPAARDAVFVAVTGYSRPEDRARTAQAGFDHHLVKPVDPGALEALMGRLPAGKGGH